MNICIFARSTIHHVVGGMEMHLKHLINGLSSRGHNISVITTPFPDNNEDLEQSKFNNVDYHIVKGADTGEYSKIWWRDCWQKFRELQDSRKNFHLVLSVSIGGSSVIKRIIKYNNLPVVCIMHGTTYNQFMTSFRQIASLRKLIGFIYYICPILMRYYLLELNLFSYSTAIISVTNETTRHIRNLYPVRKGKILTIPNGIDLNLFYSSIEMREEVRERYKIKEDERVVLFLSRLARPKGLDVAIKAISKVINNLKSQKIKLMVVGKGPEEYVSEMKTLVNDLDLNSCVLFCNYVPNEQVSAYYNACDIFIMPTLCNEGGPIVLAECMAVGKPIIASKIGGIPSIIDEGINGILVSPGDINAFANNMVKILSDSRFAETLAQKAKEKAARYFSVDKMIEDTEKVFEYCLRNK